jgi:cytochrome c
MRKVMKLCFAILVVTSMVASSRGFAAATAPADLTKESKDKCAATAAEKPTVAMIIEKANAAAELVSKKGEAAFPRFKRASSPFLFCGTCVRIHNLDGIMLMHPIKPELEGKSVLEMKSPDGTPIFVEMNKLVQEKGSGWYQYLWPRPGEKEASKKVSYVKLVKKGEKSYVIGCGVYDLNLADVQKAEE